MANVAVNINVNLSIEGERDKLVEFETDLGDLLSNNNITAKELLEAFADNGELLNAIGEEEVKEYFNIGGANE